eukprot:CAMPEP_0178631766 /NCGR_PEP_ID=MMETSP0698-20121128/11184_1 /TAXON_ID=265572 /ORGANISM="Extubocellulus spinifer, Strain CCMP396" /LENGTH=448 /DNA_ID=CAMNT_0020271213 /DNA_START=20 /DNA_END=1366 /DNA_ORIENTATION=-
MDLLASLHLDALPEQQTRTSRPSVAKALTNNPDIKLGFDACCTCAAPDVSVKCKGCGRVSYCSNKCRKEDANPPDDESQQLGHGSVVCALLRLCDNDEDVDEGSVGGDQKDDGAMEASRDRVRSEFESYPATLANVLMGGPAYQDVITHQSQGSGTLTVHIVGASAGVELWGDYQSNMFSDPDTDVYEAYAEALTDLVEMHNLEKIHLVFVGPDCPKKNVKQVKQITCYGGEGGGRKKGNKKSPCLLIETHKSNYDAAYLKNGPEFGSRSAGNCSPPPTANIVVFFNPGFTCSDYSWDGALSCIPAGVPFLVTTNTEMEAVADCQYLLVQNFIDALPQLVTDIINGDESGGDKQDDGEVQEEDCGIFFGENPFAGMRVRQSGNMANDVFVKNRWMIGGVRGEGLFGLKRKSLQKRQQMDSSPVKEKEDKKKKRKKLKGNTKKSNPALI